ncbi:MAG: hypothetical protein VX726_02545 [Planctomycetota bacterium]|nr:hypothetical protein [Planctomycetota bacterium]
MRWTTAVFTPDMMNGAVHSWSTVDRRTSTVSAARETGDWGGATQSDQGPARPSRISGSPSCSAMFMALAAVPPLKPPRIGPTPVSTRRAGRPWLSTAACWRSRTPSSLGTES